MTKSEIMAALAADYRIAYSVYASMEKQAHTALQADNMDSFNRFKSKAAHRAAVLDGMKRAAAALGIDEVEFMEAVNADTLH